MSTDIKNTKRGAAGVVLGTSAGAIVGALMGAFGLGLPGIGWAVVAGVVGMAFGGYAGAVVGSLFGGD